MSLDDFAVRKPRRKRFKEKEITGTVARHGRQYAIAVGYIWDPKRRIWILLGFKRWSGRMRPKNVRALRQRFAVPAPAIFRVMDLFVAQAVGGPGDPPDLTRVDRNTPLENLPTPVVKPPKEMRRIDNRTVPLTKKTKFIAVRMPTERNEEHPIYLGPLANVTLKAAEREAQKQFTFGNVVVMAMASLSKGMRRRIRNGTLQPGRGLLKFKKEEVHDDGADLPELQGALSGQPHSSSEDVQRARTDVREPDGSNEAESRPDVSTSDAARETLD